MKKFLKICELKELEKKVALEEITYSKMVEILNEKAYSYYNPKIKQLPEPSNNINSNDPLEPWNWKKDCSEL